MNPATPAKPHKTVTHTLSGTPVDRKAADDASPLNEEPIAKTPCKKAKATPALASNAVNVLACANCKKLGRECVGLGDLGQFSCKECTIRKVRCSLS